MIVACGVCRCLIHPPTRSCPKPEPVDPETFAPLDEFEAARRRKGITSS